MGDQQTPTGLLQITNDDGSRLTVRVVDVRAVQTRPVGCSVWCGGEQVLSSRDTYESVCAAWRAGGN